MDSLELSLATDEEGFATNTSSSQPILQHADDPLLSLEQFWNDSMLEWDNQTGLGQLGMEWQPQSGDNSMYMPFDQYSSEHIGTTENQGMQLDIPAGIGPSFDWMDSAPDVGFDDATSEIISANETSRNLPVDALDIVDEPTNKPRRVFINDHQKAILNGWITENPEPYPSKQDKANLASSTGLTLKQISSWFARTRQRKLNRIHVAGPSINTENSSSSAKHPEREQFTTPEVVSSSDTHNPVSPSVFEGLWSSNTSFPRHRGGRPMRKISSRSQSLPSVFTLDFIHLYISAPSPSSHDRLSLEALVSARGSATLREGNQNQRERPEAIYGHRDCLQSFVKPSKLDLIKVWVADVAQHAFYPSEGSVVPSGANPNAAVAGNDGNIDYSHIIGETGQPAERPSRKYIDYRIYKKPELRPPRRGRTEKPCDSAPFDTTSSAGSSVGSVNSASSYLSFGSRRGRRVAFHVSQGTEGHKFERPLFATGSDVSSNEGRPPVSTVPRKRRHSKISSDDQSTPTGTILYPCTFCRAEFAARYAWMRHELVCHRPQVQWVCGLGMVKIICRKCEIDAQSNNESIVCIHRFDDCWKRPKSERTFYRKDSFRQHLRLYHRLPRSIPLSVCGINLDEWMEEIDDADRDLTCYFCGFTCESWEKRTLHLIKHFNDGVPSYLWIPGGPYVFTPDGSKAYQFQMRRIEGRDYHWRCPVCSDGDESVLRCHNPGNPLKPICGLCGFQQNDDQCSLNRHPLQYHLQTEHEYRTFPSKHYVDPDSFRSHYFQQFTKADSFAKHLIEFHSAKRGHWMLGPIIAAIVGGNNKETSIYS
ncbi:hypothetical protein F4859DRAFT_211223 [Xylaria cf. heliscus]|nr:hypothetical protein F4859DRAFT_211223 [Xylaria cf. heliscus]